MRLRLEMEALPRLFDMLLFVFIVKCFLNDTTYCYTKRKPTQLLGWVTK